MSTLSTPIGSFIINEYGMVRACDVMAVCNKIRKENGYTKYRLDNVLACKSISSSAENITRLTGINALIRTKPGTRGYVYMSPPMVLKLILHVLGDVCDEWLVSNAR